MRLPSAIADRLASLAIPTFLALAASLAPMVAARADAVGPPPTDCVPGSEAVFCHGPPTCRVLACTADGDCTDGRVCRPASLCIEPHACGGILGAPVYDHALATCSAGGACATGTCTSVSVCLADPSFDGGAGMDAGGAVDASGADVGSALDVGGPMDTGARVDTGAPAMDTGSGAFVTTYGCGCRATSHRCAPLAFAVTLALGASMSARRAHRLRTRDGVSRSIRAG